MKRKIIVGSRGSRLALIQTGSVTDLLKRANPGLETEIKKIVTTGDRDRHSGLDRIGVDIFVKEIEEALLEGRIDIAVHSLKDVPTEIPEGLRILAVTERLDPGDVLISRGQRLAELAPGSRIGTDSLRRTAQLAGCRPDLLACPVRGNIETRLRRVANGEVDGVILAAAGLIRLGLQHKITEYLPLDSFLPAAGQGALAIEGRHNDEKIANIISPINHLPTWWSITAERAFLEALGAGCRAPIAVLGTVDNTSLKLDAMVASPDGSEVQRASAEDNTSSPQSLGIRLAQKLLAMGVGKLLREATTL
ncbi:MAG: hydroxymethylbilane synthase [Chloroflexi bacterium RBG_16_50_9]|nr:MAG: hydroxymethylbilane synthase [Chloroflexi bacterium RBG_16_50_9]